MEDTIKIINGNTINISDLERQKTTLEWEKNNLVLELIEEKIDYPQNILELIQVENESRKMNYDDIDTKLFNVNVLLTEYAKIPDNIDQPVEK